MDPDMNKYDLEHVCTGHPLMSPEEFRDIYYQAWEAYYTPEHIETLMRRAVVSGMKSRKIMRVALWFYALQVLEKVHPLQGGLFRRRYRLDRRPTLPIENPLVFYPRYLWNIVSKHTRFMLLYWRYSRVRARVETDPAKHDYTDLSLRPVEEHDLDELEMFTATESGQVAVTKMRKQRALNSDQIAAAEEHEVSQSKA